jgi:hypothetical protein
MATVFETVVFPLTELLEAPFGSLRNGGSFLRSLKFHLRSESDDHSMLRASSYVRVVLNHRLQKQHW